MARPPRGRPAATTRETIEEAAYELFLEQGFAATSVSDIATRAGVSRSSFFNYFDGKRDVLWGPVTRILDRLPVALRDRESADARGGTADSAGDGAGPGVAPRTPGAARTATAARLVCEAVCDVAGDVTPHTIPVPVTQVELMGAERDVLETGSVLLTEQIGVLREALGRLDPTGDPVTHGALAGAIVGAVLAAAQSWVAAGPGRGEFAPLVAHALAPVPGYC